MASTGSSNSLPLSTNIFAALYFTYSSAAANATMAIGENALANAMNGGNAVPQARDSAAVRNRRAPPQYTSASRSNANGMASTPPINALRIRRLGSGWVYSRSQK